MFCTTLPTEFAVGQLAVSHPLNEIYLDEGASKYVQELVEQALADKVFRTVAAKPLVLTAFTPYHLHRSTPNTSGVTVERTFVRVLPMTRQSVLS